MPVIKSVHVLYISFNKALWFSLRTGEVLCQSTFYILFLHLVFIGRTGECNCPVEIQDVPKQPCKNAPTILLPGITLTLHLTLFRVYKWLKFNNNLRCIMCLFLKPSLSQPTLFQLKEEALCKFPLFTIQLSKWPFVSTLSKRNQQKY